MIRQIDQYAAMLHKKLCHNRRKIGSYSIQRFAEIYLTDICDKPFSIMHRRTFGLLNKATKKFAKMVSGLNDETLSLIWWTGTEEVQTPKAILAVIESNRAEQYLSGPLWPIIPVLLKVAVVTGVFWLTNAWLSTQQLEAENDSVAVRTDAKLAEAVELLSKTSPKNAAILAKAIGKARKAADKMDDGTFIDKAKKGIKSLGTGVGIGIGGGVIALIAALAFGGKKRR